MKTQILKVAGGYSVGVDLRDGTEIFSADVFKNETDAKKAANLAAKVVEVIFQDLPKKGKSNLQNFESVPR